MLTAVPATARRDRGVYLARQATVAATAHEPDQALKIAKKATAIALETRSARMRGELGGLEKAMRPWHEAPVGRACTELLASLTEGNQP